MVVLDGAGDNLRKIPIAGNKSPYFRMVSSGGNFFQKTGWNTSLSTKRREIFYRIWMGSGKNNFSNIVENTAGISI